jgi:hypothetical protein
MARCRGKHHVCIKRMEFLCTYRKLDPTQKEIIIGVRRRGGCVC